MAAFPFFLFVKIAPMYAKLAMPASNLFTRAFRALSKPMGHLCGN